MKKVFSLTKKIFVASAFLALMAAPFAPLNAQAQSLTPQQQQYHACISGGGNSTDCNRAAGLTPGDTVPQQGQPTPTSNCSIWGNGSLIKGGDWAQCITDIVYVFTVGIGSGFAYVAAYFFDWAVALSLNGSIYALDFVSNGWVTARDLANMAFLFILLYIAFKIIFEADTSSTSKMLVTVIVVALLVNFSFFFTRLAIDAGNILAIQFYNAINVPPISQSAGGSAVASVAGYAGASGAFTGGASSFGNSKDLTHSIMQMLNLQGILGTESFNAFRNGNHYNFLTSLISLSFLYIAAGIMLWLLTVAFITNGIKFLVRIVVLWFLIIASPLAFVAYAIPKFKDYSSKWFNLLITHSFYPVAFMFIFLILTNFAQQMSSQNGLMSGVFQGLNSMPDNAGYIAQLGISIANVGIRMGFVLAMLYIGMKAADKIGVMAADSANHAGNWVGGKLIGTYGWMGRNSAGWASYRMGQSNMMRNWAAKDAVVGRNLWRGLNKVGRASFDARSAPGMGSVLKDAGKAGGAGGYKAAFDEKVKGRKEEASALKPSESQLAAAQEKVLKSLGDNDRDELKKLAQEYVKTQEAYAAGGADRNDVKEAKKAFDAKVKDLKIIEKSREIAGYKNDKVYADSLEEMGIHNAWGAAQGIPGWISKTDKEAAAQIHGAKTDAERIKNILEKSEKKAAAAPAAPAPAAGAGASGAAPTSAPLTRAAQAASQKTGEQLAQGILRAVEEKFGSTNLWKHTDSGQNPADGELLRKLRQEMKANRQVLKKGFDSLAHGAGGMGTIRDSGRGRVRPAENNSMPLSNDIKNINKNDNKN